jgi:type II secretory pathway pseudopilin PulG
MRRIDYPGFTLIEILVVMSVMIILGGLGLFAFGGLRDTVVINQNIADLKQDIQQIQQDAMLIQKSPDEGWVYGIGIDFTNFTTDGSYTFFKWCSPFDDFGDIKTKSEIPAYNPSEDILLATGNGYLPVEETLTNCSGTNQEGLAPYTRYLDGKITVGFDLEIGVGAQYVVFETSTGRAFLYDQDGKPVNYDTDGNFVSDPEGNVETLFLAVKRNQGKIYENIEIMPISGEIMRTQGTLTPELPDPDPYDPPFVPTPKPVPVDVGGDIIIPTNPRDIDIGDDWIHIQPPIDS